MKRLTLITTTLTALIVLAMVVTACTWREMPLPNGVKSALGIDMGDKEAQFTIKRYDLLEMRYITTGDYSALQSMKEDYPTETRMLIENILKIGTINNTAIYKQMFTYFQDSTLLKVVEDVETEYQDLTEEQEELQAAFENLTMLIPDFVTPKVYTQIGDFGESIAINGTTIGISLDKYLGTDYSLYKRYFEPSQIREMKRDYITPDCLTFYIISRYPLNDFEHSTQEARDHHYQCVQWLVNKALGREFYKDVKVTRQEALQITLKKTPND